jgi:hypothetical protein
VFLILKVEPFATDLLDGLRVSGFLWHGRFFFAGDRMDGWVGFGSTVIAGGDRACLVDLDGVG